MSDYEVKDFPITGKCIIFSAPSGAGKTTLVHYLLRNVDDLEFSVSAASRKPRGREENGIDYHFMSSEQFEQKIKENEFIEWEEVYEGMYYGTLKSEIKRAWDNNKVVVFDVDAEGGINLKKIFGKNALSVFIKPPSLFVLEQRLRDRRTETEESIQKRLKKANQELEKADQFDYVLLNDNLENACFEAKEMVTNFINN
ncbi:guanylate kinase [Paracrocinitomix mangrovi]|uniref:guanylate kinase n=1 Tax=Paracrocinitomix mangrovi TaxID=2862509 RepID=UPI001C8E3392|nr:guanylate kinase [Paracrocinitomix mangrovi]UKN00802.1 guanylate kinase [Paracrocinitomix mangrovi]